MRKCSGRSEAAGERYAGTTRDRTIVLGLSSYHTPFAFPNPLFPAAIKQHLVSKASPSTSTGVPLQPGMMSPSLLEYFAVVDGIFAVVVCNVYNYRVVGKV